jgi:hypothetical protein
VSRSPAAAAHLAELDARYEAHLAALREHAADVAAVPCAEAVPPVPDDDLDLPRP